ncbi:HNH endonuclease signature motif containing protein [Corynebacterium falsenii]|uniref:HNH endonuclease signature motif containing protein n=1 Tax=Corynebacterium falsenii TaxID=108486 RepID=UPI00234C9646|nr:HNH endonuclease signature motif containing protein [Corynebacterium falsenii]MDC7103774.1 HNH endonuclease signature motif containing protein [Corynebacterium falsenii]
MTTTPHTTEPMSRDEHTNDTGSDSSVDLTTHVDVIEASMAAVTDILTNPTAELFHTHRADIIRLLTTISHTDTLYAAFAYAAHEAGVSRVAGTTRTSTYLARLLDTSEYQARQWINLGISLYKPPEPPKDNTAGDSTAENPTNDDTDDAQSRADQLAERRRAHEAHQAHLAAQAQARKQARKLSDTKLAEINRELEHLHPSLHHEHHHVLFDNATSMAATTTVEDLKLTLRTQVRTLNSTVVDPTADYRARKLVWSPADTHGNVRVTAVLPRTGHALLETLMSPARLAAFDRSRGVNTDEDRRTMAQRRADVFMSMLETWAEDADAATAPRTRGLASLVVALSAKDLTTLPTSSDGAGGGAAGSAPVTPPTAESLNAPGVWFPTNTNARLHPIDILRLGLAEHDLGVVLDPDSGRALIAARMKRHATVEQKLMLVAEQLCCAYPGCNRAAVDCDVHHIKAWSHGGRTTIDNLTLLCRTHHRMNRDQHDGGVGMGHAEVDPDSGRVGWREARHTHEGLPDLPGAPPPTTSTTAREGSGTGQEQPSRGGSGVRPRPHPRLSDTVVVNTSTTASQAPGAQVPDQAWGSEEVQALFDPPQPQSPRHHGDRAS